MNEKKNIKVFQVGCGKMSKFTMSYVYDKQGVIVGAVDINKDVIGKDISEIMKCDNKDVKIHDIKDLDSLLKETKPDIAIVTTMSFINDINEVVRTCVKNGVNVITTCEESFYAKNSNPVLYNELDALAKANNCTITGCGYQDIFWGNMITSICSSMQRITKIKGVSSYNVEDYGMALALAHGAGFTPKKFDEEIATLNNISDEEREKLIQNKQFFPSYMWNVVGWIADKLHLHIVSMKQECIPVITEKELHSDTLDMTLQSGAVRGMEAVVKGMTKENIELEIECIGKVYTSEEKDMNEWTIFGEPTTKVFNDTPDTVRLTCADIVNRIPQVIKSRSGFVPTSELPEPTYIVNNLNEYL